MFKKVLANPINQRHHPHAFFDGARCKRPQQCYQSCCSQCPDSSQNGVNLQFKAIGEWENDDFNHPKKWGTPIFRQKKQAVEQVVHPATICTACRHLSQAQELLVRLQEALHQALVHVLVNLQHSGETDRHGFPVCSK